MAYIPQTRTRTERPVHRARSSRHAPRLKRWRPLHVRHGVGRHGHQDPGSEDRGVCRVSHVHLGGHHKHPVRRIEEGARCTWFAPTANPKAARKQWIAGTLQPAGALTIDEGALKALRAGKSLLPAGVKAPAAVRARRPRSACSHRTDPNRRGIVAYSTPTPFASWAASPPRSKPCWASAGGRR